MDRNRLNFTKAAIDRLPAPPPGKRAYYYDTRQPGLGLAITDRGTKTFFSYRWVQGRPARITIGRYSDMALERARTKAASIGVAVSEGANPQEARREKREELTLGEAFAEWLKQHGKPHTRTWKAAEKRYERHLKPLASRKLSAISAENVVTLHNRIGRKRGPYEANRVLQLLSAIYGKVIGWRLYRGENPARGVRKFPERKRERFLLPAEMPAFFGALDTEPNPDFRDLVLLALYSGARLGNLLSATWEHIDTERSLWTIPADQAKAGEPITIPLHPEAVRLLEARQERISGPWVFPARSKSGHMESPHRAWYDLLSRAEITGLRFHDLRRSLGSWQAAGGASLTVIGKSLGHRSLAATAIYSRLTLDPVRNSINAAVDAMRVAGQQQAPAEVVPMSERAPKAAGAAR